MSKPIVFISYSHWDEAEKETLLSQLSVLREAGKLEVWSDDRLRGGDDWKDKIYQAMNNASVAVLLITDHFLHSDFIIHHEVPLLLKRRRNDGLPIIPIIAQDCDWESHDWLADMNVRPKLARPVWREGGRHVNEELARIVREVREIMEERTGGEKKARTPIQVLVADDHIHAVEGLRLIINGATDMQVVAVADESPLQVPTLAAEHQPNVIVLDLAWPGDKQAGIKLVEQLRLKHPNIQIVAITNYPELVDSARKAGAFTLIKGFSKTQLLDTIRWAAQNETVHTTHTVIPESTHFEPLTQREREVLPLLHLTDKEIGVRLKIAEGTVKKHVGSILSKLGAQSRTEAAVIAERHHLT